MYSKQPHLEPRPVGIKCLLMENSTTEQTSHSVQLVLTEEDVDGAKLQEPLAVADLGGGKGGANAPPFGGS